MQWRTLTLHVEHPLKGATRHGNLTLHNEAVSISGLDANPFRWLWEGDGWDGRC